MHESFATRLKNWRGKLRQKEAASVLDIKLGTFRSWENGKRTPNKLALVEIERRMEAKRFVFDGKEMVESKTNPPISKPNPNWKTP